MIINKDNINKIKKILLEKKRIELECAHKDAVLIGLILQIDTFAYVADIEYEYLNVRIDVTKTKYDKKFLSLKLNIGDLDSLLEKISILTKDQINEVFYNISDHYINFNYEVNELFPFRYKSFKELLVNDERPDLGEIYRLVIGNFILIWNKNKSIYIFQTWEEDNPSLIETGIELQPDIHGDCVVLFYNNLFALANEGTKLYHVNNEWKDMAERVYSIYNTQPKFFTKSYQLDLTNEEDIKLISLNEGFIDFQSMVNSDILGL